MKNGQTLADENSSSAPFTNWDSQSSDLPSKVERTALTQDDNSTAQTEIVEDNPASLISPSGAAFAVICFFLPWLKMSGCGASKIATGAELSKVDSILWLLPLMGIVAFAAYFICKSQRALFKARPFIIGSSVFALGFFIYKFYGILSGVDYFNRQNANTDAETQILSGSYGTIIGFVLAIVGCFFISRAVGGRQAK